MMPITTNHIVQFELPQNLACPLPTEERGIARDQVNFMVTSKDGNSIEHAKFYQFDEWLQAGDVLVVNTSGTQAAALPIQLPNNRKGRLHFSTKINNSSWLVEIRELIDNKTHRWKEGHEGLSLSLSDGGKIKLKRRFYKNRELLNLWLIDVELDEDLNTYLNKYGEAIKYDGLDKTYPLSYYQTYFSFEPGSSEMPSASRGFTQGLIDRLIAKGVIFAPILLHTGVSSLEENEKPYPEYMEVSPISASVINAAKQQGKRVIAVGTTGIRAVESATNEKGQVIPFKGHTDLYIDADYQMKIADGLLTGFHEPQASHLHMLQSIASFEHLEKAYQAALNQSYYWHEFGDLHLILK